MIIDTHKKKPGLISVIFFSIGTMIGSGWLFAAYYSSKVAGGAAVLSWIIGAILVLFMAFILAEVAIKYPVNSLFTRMASLSHNEHFGFVIAISNWLLGLIIVPSEATASTQYIATIYKPWANYLVQNGEITNLGMLVVLVFLALYFVLNYWGIQLLARINNVITLIKLVVPAFTCIVIAIAAFDINNFVAYKHTFMPYGITSVFSAIVSCGIFYSFFGFQIAATFSAEMHNPRRNIPIALISSIVIVLIIYISLQVVFIGALPSEMIEQGWSHLNFDSPLAQLAGLLGINFLVVILYADAFVSPSGTGIVYLGATSRMLNEMVKGDQLPKYFGNRNQTVQFSRRALLITVICSIVLVFFFRNWQLISSLASTFIVISCVALPISYVKFLKDSDGLPVKLIPGLKYIAFFIYVCLSYFLLISGSENIMVAFILHVIFFICYATSIDLSQKLKSVKQAALSAWTIFAYLCFIMIYALIGDQVSNNWVFYVVFFIVTIVFYPLLINQKKYSLNK